MRYGIEDRFAYLEPMELNYSGGGAKQQMHTDPASGMHLNMRRLSTWSFCY